MGRVAKGGTRCRRQRAAEVEPEEPRALPPWHTACNEAGSPTTKDPMRQPALAYAAPPTPLDARPRRRAPVDLGEILATASAAIADATQPRGLSLEEVARWCAEVGGVDPRLE